MIINKELKIDLAHDYFNNPLRFHEGDVNGAAIVLSVFNNDTAFDLTGHTVKYDAVIAGMLAEQDASAAISGTNNNIVTVPVTPNMTALNGLLQIDVKFKKNDDILFLSTIKAYVERSIINNDTIIDISGTTIGQRLDALETAIDNTYSKEDVDDAFMELAPNTALSSIENIKDGQMFRIGAAAYMRTDGVSDENDYIELANKNEVYSKAQTDTLLDNRMAYKPSVTVEEISSLKNGQLFLINGTPSIKAQSGRVDLAKADDVYSKTQTYKKGEVNSLINTAVNDIRTYIGYTDNDIVGLQVDFEHNRFTRLGAAANLPVYSVGNSDYSANKAAVEAVFDLLPMYGGRRRCNVADDGTINAYYGDQGYADDGSNGQVMVYQPAFWYKVVPLKLEKNTAGLGYHIRKANYYVSGTPKAGFKRHPLFYDANGNAVDYVLLSAYEGSMYDVSESAYVNDSVDTSVSYGTGDLLCSVAGKKPISGKLTGVGSKAQFETMANNLGSGWHLNTIKAENANQLLMMIELGTLNTQTAIGRGVVDQSGSSNASSLTGSTASLGNATGMASSTIAESAGTETINTTNGKLSVSYRGVENPWGNIWKHTNGINLWGDSHMGGGQVFICDDFTYNESKRDGNYQSAGFSIANGSGYISAFGYDSEDYDWVLMPSEATGNSSLPVGDYCYATSNLNGYRIAILGGSWSYGGGAGVFSWRCINAPGSFYDDIGGRLLYVPTAAV